MHKRGREMSEVKRYWGCIDGLNSSFVLDVDFKSANAALDAKILELEKLRTSCKKLKDDNRSLTINLGKLERRATSRESVIKGLQRNKDNYRQAKNKTDALAAQRDEGLAREAELRDRLAEARTALEYLMDRFEAEVCVCDNCGEEKPLTDSDSAEYLREFLASPGCADGEPTK
jgi:DNA repair exonuclease SbcCD ATPase subunit